MGLAQINKFSILIRLLALELQEGVQDGTLRLVCLIISSNVAIGCEKVTFLKKSNLQYFENS